ncbi:hypothetical protein BDF19DRAFT_444510 [Syncephalis fuscata]|nr:hypothetical protein BDF19DRAFT_444510 [Syncephalis fuscata]
MIEHPSQVKLIWGFIHTNSTGEMSLGDFVLLSAGADEVRQKVHSNFIQLLLTTTIFWTFLRNVWHAGRLVWSSHTSVASWCCFLQALMGIYRVWLTNWIYAFGLMVSSICVSICLLLRAYVITSHNRVLLILGVAFTLPLPGILWIFWTRSVSTITPNEACITIYPPYLPWIRFMIDMPINSIFSIVFLRVVINQYRAMGNECWQKVKSDGIIYLFGVILSNTICAVVTAFELAGNWSEIFFYLDWITTSTLLTHQHEGMREAFNRLEGASHYQGMLSPRLTKTELSYDNV